MTKSIKCLEQHLYDRKVEKHHWLGYGLYLSLGLIILLFAQAVWANQIDDLRFFPLSSEQTSKDFKYRVCIAQYANNCVDTVCHFSSNRDCQRTCIRYAAETCPQGEDE